MTTTVVDTVAVRNFNSGSITRPARNLPSNFQSVTFTIDCTTLTPGSPFTGFANPFNSPSMSITFGMNWSWDGGATFPMSTQNTDVGNAAGWTGKDGNPVQPNVTLGAPSRAGVPPNAYQAFAMLVNGPVTTGLTVSETTSN